MKVDEEGHLVGREHGVGGTTATGSCHTTYHRQIHGEQRTESFHQSSMGKVASYIGFFYTGDINRLGPCFYNGL